MDMNTTSRKAGRLPGVLLAVAALIGAGTFAMGAALAADSVYNAPPANVIYQKPDAQNAEYSRDAEHSRTSDFSDLANRAYKADEVPNGGPTGGWVVHPAFTVDMSRTVPGSCDPYGTGMCTSSSNWPYQCTRQNRDFVYTFANGAQIITRSQSRIYNCRGEYYRGGSEHGWR